MRRHLLCFSNDTSELALAVPCLKMKETRFRGLAAGAVP